MADPQKLGRYELRRVLGKGAMGVVYEGHDPVVNRAVAIKTILRNAAIDAETAAAYSERFKREAQAAGRLNHPNIVHVYDFAEQGDVAYLVMEHIQGRELRALFDAKEKFEPAEVVRIMGELLDALDFAHEAGVIHRDVKPANVMLDAQRRVKLADFGVARIQDSDRSMAGTMVGTPAFMSPEQIKGGKVDRRTDIFSAGVVLYQLLTGEQPFKGEGAWTVAKKIVEDDPPLPSSLVVSISPAFDAVVRKALAKLPPQRFASARLFADALRAALKSRDAAPADVPAAVGKAQPKASDTELEFWRAIQTSTDAAEFEFYLAQFPEGTYAALARHKIAALEKARRESEEVSRREAEENERRAAAERARQAEALARLKAQEAARAKAKAIDEDATVAVGNAEKKRFVAVPAIIAAVVIIAAAASYPLLKRSAAPEPTPPRSEVSAADIENIKRETEARIRREYAEKSAAEQAAMAKAAAEREIAEKRLAAEKAGQEKAAAEKAKSIADKAAAEKASAEKALKEKAVVERAAADKAAAEKAVAEKAAAEKAAAEKAAAEKVAAEKAAAERAVADAAELRRIEQQKGFAAYFGVRVGDTAERLVELLGDPATLRTVGRFDAYTYRDPFTISPDTPRATFYVLKDSKKVHAIHVAGALDKVAVTKEAKPAVSHPSVSTASTTCAYQRIFKFADGSSGCFDDYRYLRTLVAKNLPMDWRSLAIAVTDDREGCGVYGWNAWNHAGTPSNADVAREKCGAAASKNESGKCTCFVIYDSNRPPDRQTFIQSLKVLEASCQRLPTHNACK